MSRQTTNYGLTKPDYTDTADIEVINSNMDIIDQAFNNLTNKVNANTETIENLDTTKANKSTTLAGYGITDAYTKTQTDKLLNNKVDKEAGKGLFSGSYNDLTDTPTIPSKTSELQNDSGYLTEHQDLSSYATNTQLNQALENKADKATTLAGYGITDAQKKLTNPLTQSDVVNNLTTSATNKPLSANQGRLLSANVNERFYKSVSDEWIGSKTYKVGQYCIYDNKLWKCLVQHSGQTPSEGTYWTQTSVDEEIVNVNSSLNEVKNVVMFHNAGSHNSVYRGKNLGSVLTDEQKAQINAGTFEDMYIGDYWTINGVTYRIAHFDYWLHCGNTECTKHHIVVVPDSNLYTAKMNDSNITTGGYVGSKMYTEYLAKAKTTIRNAFGTANILTHRELLTNTTSGNRATNWSWYDSDIELMNESMVYGSPVGSKAVDDSINFNVGIDKSQLALFALDPSRITNRADWWLRCVVSSVSFAFVGNGGDATNDYASNARGVRPAFGITAE